MVFRTFLIHIKYKFKYVRQTDNENDIILKLDENTGIV